MMAATMPSTSLDHQLAPALVMRRRTRPGEEREDAVHAHVDAEQEDQGRDRRHRQDERDQAEQQREGAPDQKQPPVPLQRGRAAQRRVA